MSVYWDKEGSDKIVVRFMDRGIRGPMKGRCDANKTRCHLTGLAHLPPG